MPSIVGYMDLDLANPNKALSQLQAILDRRSSARRRHSQFHPGCAYTERHKCLAGEGVPEDHSLAYHAARLAAQQGLPQAQAELGFRLGLGLMPPPPGLIGNLSSEGVDTWQPSSSGSSLPLFEVGVPQTADSLLQYYFAAGRPV